MTAQDTSTIPKNRESSARTATNGSANGFQPLPAGSVVCRHCHGVNQTSRKFCGHCGKSLWEPCPKCSIDGPATETFCGACGANIPAAYEERAQRFEAELARVREFHAADQYEQALDVLSRIIRPSSLRLEAQHQRAQELIALLTAERDRRRAESAAVLAKGRELEAQHNYEAAVQTLQSIPTSLRSPEFTASYDQIHAHWQEVVSLTADIRQAMAEKRTLELLPKLQRLMELQPNHAQARGLAEQLRERYVEAAKKKLGDHRYAEALTLLRQIPEPVRTSGVEDLQVRAAELAWLLSDLRTSPAVDQTLLAVGERLAKLAPGNEHASQLRAQLLERAKTKPQDPRIALPLWAAPPKAGRLGPSVDWLGGFGKLAVGDAAAGQVATYPGCLFVAAGLALQGLEKSQVSVNLLPQPQTSAFGGLGLLRAKKKTVRAAWGLDLTETGLKAIKLVCDEGGHNLAIEACEVIEHKKNLSQPGLENERPALLAATLQTFTSRHDLAGCKVCASLEGSQLLARFLNLPPLASKQIPSVVEYEARGQLPFALSEVAWDYQVLAEASAANELQQHRVLLLAAKQFYVQSRLSAFKSAQINVDMLQSDAVALHNLAIHELLGDSPATQTAVALVDVGSGSTNVVVSWPEGVWFRGIQVGGDDLTRALVKQFNLSFSQAEQLKRDPAKARRLSQLYEVLEPLFEELCGEVERSLAAFENERTGVEISRVFVVGGGMRMHGLWRQFRAAAK